MNRRDAIKVTAVVAGAALAAAAGVVANRLAEIPHQPPRPPGFLDPWDEVLAEAVADTILPTTAASPGAKAAGAGRAMNLLLTACYDDAAQQRVARGLAELRARCRDRHGREFTELAQNTRERLLREVDAEAQRAGDAHYFTLLRELALRAYFSSEIGMTRALRYVQTPGRWEGCVPKQPGQPAWG